jgi:hypothetical protein
MLRRIRLKGLLTGDTSQSLVKMIPHEEVMAAILGHIQYQDEDYEAEETGQLDEAQDENCESTS